MFCIILCQTALTHSWPDNWLSSLPGNGNTWPSMGGSGTIHNNKSWLAETKPAYITPTSSVHVDIHAAQQPGHCSNAAGERVNKTGLHVIILTWHHGMTRPRRPVPVVGVGYCGSFAGLSKTGPNWSSTDSRARLGSGLRREETLSHVSFRIRQTKNIK